MLNSDEWRLLRPEYDEVLAFVLPLLPVRSAKQVHDWFSAGEQGFGMDQLIWALLIERIPLDARSHELLSHILIEMGPLPGRILPCLSDPAGVLALIDREDEPLRRRGLPPQRGGHTAGAGRGSVAFPMGWTDERVRRVGELVAEGPVVAHLANDRVWRSAVVDAVTVGVLAAPTGKVRAVVPIAPPATRADVRLFADPDRPTPIELVAFTVRDNCERLQEEMSCPVDEAEVLRQLHLATEYDELADALIARADQEWPHLDPDARRRARALLRTFDLPVEGCAHLNDRDATLGRWAV